MPRHRTEPAAPSPLVPPLLRHVRAQGGSPEALAARFALPENAEALDEVPIGPQTLGALLDAAARELGDPALGLHLPEVIQRGRYGAAELAARASPTLRDALERLVRYGALWAAHGTFALELGDDEACFTHRLAGQPRGAGQHVHDYALAWTLTLARQHTGLPLPPRRVWFIHPRPRSLAPLHAFFGTEELDFGRTENGFALEPALLTAPLRTADPRLLATADHLAERELRGRPSDSDFVGRVSARIRDALPQGQPSARTIGQALHMSSRTLQRRLEEEGTRFSEVLDDVRAELARRQVAEGTPLAEIAYGLGFSDVGTFRRAFKRWTGRAPGAFRRTGP